MNQLDAIPCGLRDRRQWVVWRFQRRGEKQTKIPLRADGGGRAKSTDPSTWATYDEAVAAVSKLSADGLGYAFSEEDDYVGVDLDEALSDVDRGAILSLLSSYSETSVSGRGAHVIVRGKLPGPGRRRGPVEVYASGRYFAMTGKHITGTPTTIEDRQPELDELLERFIPPSPEAEAQRPIVPIDLDDRDLLDKAMSARNGSDFRDLYEGRWESRYTSRSEADIALAGRLAFWFGRDPKRIDRVFRSSGLMRPKWERANYRDRTIEGAITACRDTYTPRPRVQPVRQPEASAASIPSSAPPPTVAPVARVRTLDEWIADYDRERRLTTWNPIRLGFAALDADMRGISAGQVAAFAARAGVGKSWLLSTVAQNIAAEGELGCLILTLEMPGAEWVERQLAIDADVAPEEVEVWSRQGELAQHSVDFLKRMQNTVMCEEFLNLKELPTVFNEARERLGTPLRAVLVDYAGLVDVDGRDAYERASKLGKGLKAVAKAEKVAMVVAMQLSRAGGDGSEPVKLDMLRDSGVLEESMDFILGAWRPDKAANLSPPDALELRNVLRVRLLKNRKGADGRVVDLRFRETSRRVDDEWSPTPSLGGRTDG